MRITATTAKRLGAKARRQVEAALAETRKQRKRKPAPTNLEPGQDSQLEAEFDAMLRMHKIPAPVRQYKFCADRDWKLDRVWVDQVTGSKLALEIDGETVHGHYHQLRKDAEKRNQAVLLGFRLLIATGEMIRKDPGALIDVIKEALGIDNG